MRTRILFFALVAIAFALGSTGVVADGSQPFHVSGQVGGTNLDSDRDTRNDGVWWGVGLGYFFTDDFSLDLEYDEFSGTFRGFDTAVPGATYDQWKLSNVGLMGRYFITDWAARPFFGGGIGYQQHRNVVNEGNALALSLVVGLQGQLSKHWSTRAQLMYRVDSDAKSVEGISKFNDLYFSVGLNFDFGGSEPPPPPPPPPPAEPPPPPPNPDLDGDGVLNEHDKCPNTRPGVVVDLDGCEVEAVIELPGVYFDFDSAALKPEAKAVLDEAAALLNKHERVVVEVAGHTDSTGPEAYNEKLSQRRAESVKDYLVAKGVKASRMTAHGYGESRPVATNDTKEGRAENRRVELVVLDK